MGSELALSDVTVLELLLVAGVALATGTLSGMTGFGGGMLLPPVLAPILGVKAVVPVMAVAMLIANIHRLWLYRRSLNPRPALAVLVTGVPCVVLGALVYVDLPPRVVGTILGVVLLSSLPLGRWLARRRILVGPRGLAGAGAAYGLIAGTTTGMGMFMVPVIMGAGLAGPAFLATDAAISVAINAAKALVFGSFALLTPQLLLAALLVGLCSFPGNYIARWIILRTSAHIHRLAMELLILAGGVSLLWVPVRELLG